LLAVLVFEIWLDYRRDIVLLAQSTTGWRHLMYRVMSLGSSNISPRSLEIDDRVGWIITLIGIPSAFLLHGYVGFIFGSIKANPWWSTPLMPVVFLFSAMVSGIALVMLMYMFLTWSRKQSIDMHCVDTVARYLFYTFIIDFTLEMLDLIHRIYAVSISWFTPGSTCRRLFFRSVWGRSLLCSFWHSRKCGSLESERAGTFMRWPDS
jgi:Ni/Fe-hydrogenase subunit HybB-like protein